MEHNGNPKITKLVPTGYPLFDKQMTNLILTKGWLYHIKYPSFEEYLEAEQPKSELEIMLREKLTTVKDKRLDKTYTKEKRLEELLAAELSLVSFNTERTKGQNKWTLEEEMLRGLFLQHTTDRYHAKIGETKSCHAIWRLLKKESNQDEPGQMMMSLEKFFGFTYLKNEKLLDTLARIQLIGQAIRDRGVVPTFEQMLCYQLLCRMPSDYSALQQQLFQLDEKDLVMDVIAKKFGHEDCLHQMKGGGETKPRTNDALYTQTDENRNRGRGRDASRGGQRGGAQDQNRNNRNGDNNKDQKQGLSQVKCKNSTTCKGFVSAKFADGGATECKSCYVQRRYEQREKNNNQTNKNNNNNNNNNNQPSVKTNYFETFNVVLESAVNNTTITTDEKLWTLDSGCTSNVTNSAVDMINLSESDAKIRGPTGERSNASQQGDAEFQIKMSDGSQEKILFKNTIVVPELKRNLLSVGSICASSPDVAVIFRDKKCMIFKGQIFLDGTTIVEGYKDSQGLYVLSNERKVDAAPRENSVLNAAEVLERKEIIMTLDQAHDAFCHINKQTILKMQEATKELKISNPDDEITCTICAAAKMNRKKFAPEIPMLAKGPGEVIYSDVCGKISPPTKSGCHYLVHFLDSFSGYIFGTTIKAKSDTLPCFQQVRNRIETQIGVKPKRLCSDGGGEYTGAIFQDYLKNTGMIHQKSPPNTPQRAGRSERLNKICFDGARAMLEARKMPLDFWGAAVKHFIYIYNRTPKTGELISRYEKFFGERPSLKHCLPFGCPVMVHNHDPHLKKLEPRAFEGVFVGFNEENHNYQIWLVKEKKCIESRSVKPYPNEFVVFADYKHVPFEIDNENNWLGEGEDDDAEVEEPEAAKDKAVDQEEESDEDDDEIVGEDIMGQPIYAHQLVAKPKPKEKDPILPRESRSPRDERPRDPRAPKDERPWHPREPREPREQKAANKPRREKEPKVWMTEDQIFEVLNLEQTNVPKSHKEVLESPMKEKWLKAEREEFESLMENKVFEIVPRTRDKRILKSKVIYAEKPTEDMKESKCKARCVALGYAQREGEDYFETFSSPLKLGSARYLISLAAMKGLKIFHRDVKSAFLNGKLEELIYIEIPDAFAEFIGADRSTNVLRLDKSLYGLKQASRVWGETFTAAILEMGFVQSEADPSLFVYHEGDVPTAWVGIYVDDSWTVATEEFDAKIGKLMEAKFKMHNLGKLTYSLGMKVEQMEDGIKISQTTYIEKLAAAFGIISESSKMLTPLPKKPQADAENSEPFEDVRGFQKMVGGLIYIANATRPDVAYPTGYLARSMQKPTIADWKNGKRVIKYLYTTKTRGLKYSNSGTAVTYSDSSYAEEKDAKSVGGYVVIQSGAAITWRSTKQELVAQSSAEAEYIALAEAVKEAIWIRKLQMENLPQANHQIMIYEDNQSAIKLSQNPIHTNRSKHINVRYHATRDYVKKKMVKIEYCPTQEMIADIMTKSLDQQAHAKFCTALGLVD